jgi:hypothetical protein
VTTACASRYDKSLNEGRGDRADPSTWPKVNGPVDIVLFEGWMSGFSPLPEEEVGGVHVCVHARVCVCAFVCDGVHVCMHVFVFVIVQIICM